MRPYGPSRTRVYPRVCGVTVVDEIDDLKAVGLSPRVRGHPMVGVQGAHESRSIPACAGSPLIRLTFNYTLTVYPRVCGVTPMPDRHTEASH